MKVLSSKLKSIIGKVVLGTAALGFFLIAGAPDANANDWDDCNRRAGYADWRYHEALEHFGPYSSEARYWAHERHEAFERREHFRHEWREHGHDRREYRDYDRR